MTTSRIRSDPDEFISGSLTKAGYTTVIQAQKTIRTCSDTHGNPDGENPFYKIETDTGGASWSGGNNKPYPGDRICDKYPFKMVAPSGGTYPSMNVAALATELMAKTNPGRAHIQLPVFLSELRDLPRMVRLGGNNFLERAASANLSIQFGWRTFVSDVLKLINFTGAVDNRVNELKRLESKGGLKRRMTLSTDVHNFTSGLILLESNAFIQQALYKESGKRRMWGTIRWSPNTGNLPGGSESQRSRARRLVLGLGTGQQLKNLWDALPWTWLADWFTNTGDFLEASNNSVGHVSGPICIMEHTFNTRTYQLAGYSNNDYAKPEGSSWMSYESKRRYVYSGGPSLTASLPFLNGRQLSILGSLAILRGR